MTLTSVSMTRTAYYYMYMCIYKNNNCMQDLHVVIVLPLLVYTFESYNLIWKAQSK